MIQGAQAGGPLWGWDGDGDDDWDGAALGLLALAVVAATALALHWFGSRQDQEVAGPKSTVGGTQSTPEGRLVLHPESQVSGGSKGDREGQKKPHPPRRSQGSLAMSAAQDQEPLVGRVLAVTAGPPLSTLGNATSGGTLGERCGNPTPEAQRGEGREPPRPDTALLGRSKAGATPAPLLIRFTLRSSGGEAELQAGAGGAGANGPARPAPIHREQQDTKRWDLPGSLGTVRRSRRRQADAVSSGDPTCHPPKPDPLRLGAAVSVWDAIDAASAAAVDARSRSPGAGSRWSASAQGPAQPALPQAQPALTVPGTNRSERGREKCSPQAAPAQPLGAQGEAGQATETSALAPREAAGAPAPTEGRPWVRKAVIATSDFSRALDSAGEGPEEVPVESCGARAAGAAGPAEGGPGLDSGLGRTGEGRESQPRQGWEQAAGGPVADREPQPTRHRGRPTVEGHSGVPSTGRPATPPPRGGDPGRPSPKAKRPRKHSMCEIALSSEHLVSQVAPEQHQGPVLREEASSAGRRGVLTEKQKEAQKLMVFLQRPGSWGRVKGSQKPHLWALEAATAVQRPQRLDLGSCLEVLAFAQQHGEPGLAQETYALMSSNLLHVLGDPHLYRQLSGADRERILSLRTRQGQAMLGVLVLPRLYQVCRPGFKKSSRGEESPEAQTAPLPHRTFLHVFHPQENIWRPLTQVPEEAPLRGCGLCTMHNYLFLAGGIRGSGAQAVCSKEVFCYNPLTNIWSQVRPMQQARAQLKLVALDGLLYAIGGECLYSMERYDPRTDAWTLRAPLPEGTFPVAHEAVACHGDIYVTGGHLFYRLLRYSPEKDSWDECPYSASHRRSSDMVALGGFLYRFDLLRGVGAAVMRYNTVTGSWSRAASLPLPEAIPLRCTVLGNTIYCLNHQVTATFAVSEGTAQFQAQELQPFPLGNKGILCPFILTLPTAARLQTSL
ncbi:kelch domain-containing protein 7B [Urocitellus parryii]